MLFLKPKIISYTNHPRSDAIGEGVDLQKVLAKTALAVFSN